MTIAYVRVPVANVWKAPDRPREMDGVILKRHPSVFEWLSRLDEEKDGRLGLVGRLETQLLLGEPVWVKEEINGWAHVFIPGQPHHEEKRGYPGWVPAHHLAYHPDFHHMWESHPFAIVTALKTGLLIDGAQRTMEIGWLTRLPFIGEANGDVIVMTPSGIPGRVPAEHVHIDRTLPVAAANRRIETARRFLGLPYLWGGTSVYGMDCSGFVHRVFEACGIRIPRDAHVQAAFGRRIERDSLEPGDLVFFAYEQGRGRIHHVGMYVGNDRFIHAPRTGLPVQVQSLSQDAPYAEEFCFGRRYDGSEFPASIPLITDMVGEET